MSRRIYSLMLVGLLVGPEVWSQEPAHVWSQNYAVIDDVCTNSTHWGTSVCVDAVGNVVTAGYFQGAMDFGGGLLCGSHCWQNIFLVKLSTEGNHIWSHRFGDSRWNMASDVAVDENGNVILVGTYEDSISFGGDLLSCAGDYCRYILKLDPDGIPMWSLSYGNSGNGLVATDNLNNIYCTGDLSGHRYGVLNKFSPEGNHLWSVSAGDSENYVAVGNLVTDQAGNIILVGRFNGTVDFGGGPLTCIGVHDVFIVKYDSNGNNIWSHRYGNIEREREEALSVDVDNYGNIIFAGVFDNLINFGGESFYSPENWHIYLVKLDASGNHIWSKGFTDDYWGWVGSVSATTDDDIVLVGNFGGTVDFGGEQLVSFEAYNAYVAKFSRDGSHIWSTNYGDAQSNIGAAGTVDASGDIFIMADFTGTIDFGGGPLQGVGQWDVALAKFSADAVPIYLSEFTVFPVENHIVVEWNTLATGAIGEFMLVAGQNGQERVVPYQEIGDNIFVAADADVEFRIGGEVTYTLFYGEEGLNWVYLDSKTVLLEVPDVHTFLIGAKPNPFNPQTTIAYELASAGHVSLMIYNLQGRKVAVLVDGLQPAGPGSVVWDGQDMRGQPLPSSVYIARLESADGVFSQKLVLTK